MDIGGERARPLMELTAAAEQLRYGDFRLPRLRLEGSYADLRAQVRGRLMRDTSVALSAEGSLPLDLRLIPVRQRLLPDTLRGVIRADSVDLSVLEAITPEIQRAEGTLRSQIEIGGTWKKPTFTGSFQVANGEAGIPELGIRLREIQADVLLGPDSIAIRVLTSHELFHAIQDAYDAGQDRKWTEGTAAWNEEMTFPEQDDYEGFVATFLELPERDFSRAF